jgi:poly-gamma-glutamate biosynthesis protein PgsC/CapC
MLLTQSIALGLFVGFIFFELTGIVAGGLVTPGYFALYYDRPQLIAETLMAALITMVCIRLLSMVTILYGRRRFIVTVLIGFALQWSMGVMFWGQLVAETRIDALGFIIPGLLAHEMERQGAGKTLVLLFIISAIVRAILHLLGLVG